ncbi:MAG: hypothetical protein ACU843_03245 [Gammaproteobacteria bacterium]
MVASALFRSVRLKPDPSNGSFEAVLLDGVKACGKFHQGRKVANNFRIKAGFLAAILATLFGSIRKICSVKREEFVCGCKISLKAPFASQDRHLNLRRSVSIPAKAEIAERASIKYQSGQLDPAMLREHVLCNAQLTTSRPCFEAPVATA